MIIMDGEPRRSLGLDVSSSNTRRRRTQIAESYEMRVSSEVVNELLDKYSSTAQRQIAGQVL